MRSSTLGRRILLRRRDLGLTQKELAEQVGLQPNTIARLERGHMQDLGAAVVARIADVLRCTTDYLLGRTETIDEEPANQRQGAAVA